MRRLLFAVGLLGALLVVFASTPAGAVNAGDPCSAGDAAAGTVTTTSTGATVKCVAGSNGQAHWTTVVAGVNPPTTVAAATAAAATPPAVATTGLNHMREFVELSIILLALGAAIVLELRARAGLDRLHLQRLIAQLPPTRRSTRNEPH